MKKSTGIRRTVVAMACGVGLFQATLVGAGAYQSLGTPEAEPGAPSGQVQQTEGEDAGAFCEVHGPGPMAPGGITVIVTSTDDDGSSQTVTVSVEGGMTGSSAVAPVGGVWDVTHVPDADGTLESTAVEEPAPVTGDVSELTPAQVDSRCVVGIACPVTGDVSKLTPAQATPAAPEEDTSRSSPEAGEARSTVVEDVPDDAAVISQIQVDGSADVFCAVAGGGTESGAAVVPATVAPQDAAVATGSIISPADAIVIAQVTATGEFQSLVLENDGNSTVYVLTFDDQVIRIDARTGEILPPEPRP